MDSKKRTIVKTIFFKILTTGTTACITGLKGALFIHFLMTIIYLVYERVWNNIKWGRTEPKQEAPQIQPDQQPILVS